MIRMMKSRGALSKSIFVSWSPGQDRRSERVLRLGLRGSGAMTKSPPPRVVGGLGVPRGWGNQKAYCSEGR